MDPLLWGRGEDIDGARHKKIWRRFLLFVKGFLFRLAIYC